MTGSFFRQTNIIARIISRDAAYNGINDFLHIQETIEVNGQLFKGGKPVLYPFWLVGFEKQGFA